MKSFTLLKSLIIGLCLMVIIPFTVSGQEVKHYTSFSVEGAYYLPDMLPTLKALRENAQTGGHSVYGVDGSASAYVYDADADGNIESGSDKVWAFFGLRRGGRASYALEITNPDQPSLMWSVNAATPGMS